MKRIYISITICLLSAISGFSQLNGSGIVPDFNLQDINNQQHHLYEYLNQNKPVILDFYAVWCGSCQENAAVMQKVYAAHGALGDNSVIVLGLESDDQSTDQQVIDFMTTNKITYPNINTTLTVPDLYEVSYVPMIYVICPDRSYKLMGDAPDYLSQAIDSVLVLCNSVSTTSNDARVMELFAPTSNYCFGNIIPEFLLQNYGQNPLHSVDIISQIDGISIDTIHWSGLREQYQTERVTLNKINNISVNRHNYKLLLINPNYSPDDNLANDSVSTNFTMRGDAAPLLVTLSTDNHPEDNAWQIWEGNTFITDAGYYPNIYSDYSTELCLDFGSCYTFSMYDIAQNGFNFGGKLTITFNNNIIYELDSSNFDGYVSTFEFCTDSLLAPVAQIVPVDNTLNFEPDDSIVVSFDKPLFNIDNQILTSSNIKQHILFKKNNIEGENVEFEATINNQKNRIVIKSSTNLYREQKYFVSIDNNLKGNYNNRFEGISTSFTTKLQIGINQEINNSKIFFFINSNQELIIRQIYNSKINNIEIISMLGEIKLIKDINNFEEYKINISNWTKGIYIIKISNENEIYSNKIILK